ncbi:MAG: TraR/DksA C4-type zinc finger protein [Acidimicrobiia bacterium]
MLVPPTRIAPRTIAGLVDLLLARQASISRRADALRSEVVDALIERDRSDLFDHDDPSVDFDATVALMQVQRTEQRLWEVDQALARVADGTFGCCTVCGSRIPLERLRVLPATATCVACSDRSSRRTWRVDGHRLPADAERIRSSALPGMVAAGAGR